MNAHKWNASTEGRGERASDNRWASRAVSSLGDPYEATEPGVYVARGAQGAVEVRLESSGWVVIQAVLPGFSRYWKPATELGFWEALEIAEELAEVAGG